MADDSINLGVADYLANRSEPVGPQLNDALQHGVQQNPDTYARMRAAARDLDVPLPAALSDPKYIEQQQRVRQLDAPAILLNSPKTAGWLSQPDNAAVAHDDVPVLQSVEQTLKNLWGIVKGSGDTLAETPWRAAQAVNEFIDPFGDMGLAQRRTLDPKTGSFATAGAATAVQAQGTALAARAQSEMPTAGDWMQAGVNSGIASLLQNAPGMALALATRNPELALSVMGAQTGLQAYGEARDQGVQPAAAAGHGVKQGAVEVMTEKFPMEALVKDLKVGSGFVKTWAHQVLSDLPGEVGATIIQNFNDWADLHPDKPFMDYVTQLPGDIGATVIATAMGITGHTAMEQAFHAVAKHAEKQTPGYQQAQAAEQMQAQLGDLVKAAEASAVRQRDPQTFKEYVDHVTQDTPVESVYINAHDLVDVLAQGDPAKLEENANVLQSMPSVMPQLEDALKSGGLVQIPTSELLAFTPETGLGKALMDHLKVDPEGYSPKEAEHFLQTQSKGLREEVAKIVQDKGLADEFQASAERVHAQIKGQLDQVGRYTTDVNDVMAMLPTRFYATMAARLGMSPEAFAEQHQLHTQAQGVADGALAQPEASAKAIEDAAATDGVQLKVMPMSADDAKELGATPGTESAPAVWLDSISRATDAKGAGAEAMRKLTTAADAHGVTVRLSAQDDGSGKLTDFYKSFGFQPSPTHPHVMERPPQPPARRLMAARRALAQSYGDHPEALAEANRAAKELGLPEIEQGPPVDRADIDRYIQAGGEDQATSNAPVPDPFGATPEQRLLSSKRALNYLADEPNSAAYREAERVWQESRAAILGEAAGPANGSFYQGYEPGLGFQSSLFNTVLDAKQSKASGDQWLAMIQNTPGVKKEEIEWIGLPEALKLMGAQGAVTREQVLTYIAQNGVRLEEHQLGGKAEDIYSDEGDEHFAEEIEDGTWTVYGPNSDGQTFDDQEDAEGYASELNADGPPSSEFDGPTQYADYQAIKGGENYREVLLALPSAQNPTLTRDFTAGMGHWSVDNVLAHTRLADFTTPDGKRVLGVLEIQSDWHQKGRDKGYAQEASPEERAAAEQGFQDAIQHRNTALAALDSRLMPALQARLADLEENRNAAANGEEKAKADQDRLYGAWQVALREHPVTDGRTPPEVSAAHAAWSQAGYLRTSQGKAREVLAQEVNRLKSHLTSIERTRKEPVPELSSALTGATMDYALWKTGATPESLMEHEELKDLANALSDTRLKLSEADQRWKQARGEGGIPNAPFKATWPALTMKRILSMAIEQGYDHVAWATGEQQADLYDMREQVGQIMVRPSPTDSLRGDTARMLRELNPKGDPTYEVRVKHDIADAIGSGGHGAVEDSYGGGLNSVHMTADKIREVFGAALGGQITEKADSHTGDDYAELDAGDFAVGGEGHKAFYNRNLVNITNDIIKKFGGKVGVMEIVTPRTELNLREYEEAKAQGTLGSKQWGFEITDKMRAEEKATKPPLFQADGARPAPKGSFNPSTNTITLLRNADLSTYLHELGHFFLETMARVASSETAPADLKADWDKAASFMGFGGIDAGAWLALPIGARREGHEKWARGFEAYLRDGKAPTPQLKGAFQRFKSWLVHVYKDLAQLNVELTPEVTGVFDRLLATQDEIASAEASRGFAPVFDTKPEGMTDLEWEAYQRLGADATATAEDQLGARSIRDMRWLSNTRARLIRELGREASAMRKGVRAEVEAEVLNEPTYAAMRFLRRGIAHGETVEGNHRFAISDLQEMYPGGATPQKPTAADFAASMEGAPTPPPALDFWKLGVGKYGMLGSEGLHPDQVAELFGFTSGDELVRELLKAEPLKDRVEGLTDQRMLERYGDLSDPQAIAKAADEAIHNDARLRFVATEANAMAKAAGRPRVMADAARDFARELVGRTRIRDLRPAKYTGAEQRAAAAAARASVKGDLVLAATEKRNQLINGHAARAAYQAQEEVAKALRLFSRLQGAGAQKSIDRDYREQIDALLERFDLRTGQTLKAIDKRKSLASWIKAMQDRGLEPLISDDLANEAFRKSYKDMSVEELRGLVDAVKNIAHLGRLKNKLLTAAEGRTYQAVVDEATTAIEDNAYKTHPDKIEHNTVADDTLAGLSAYAAQHRKLSSLIRQISGMKAFDNGGILWRTFIRPMNRANDMETVRREQATRALMAIYKPILKAGGLRKKTFIQAIGTSLSLEGRLSVALNWGNELNRARVMDGDKWSVPQVNMILESLTAEQLGFVNQLHEYLDSYWPEVAAKEQRVSGVAPEKVAAEAYQVRSADGELVQMRGGYYPIKYDAERSFRSEADTKSEELVSMQRGLYGRATTKRGHTKARVEKVERPVRKDINVAFQHVNEVIHDLAFHEYLIDANRLLKSLENTIKAHYGAAVVRTMRNSLEAIAVGDLPAENSIDRVVSYLRTGSSIVGLGLNLMTAIQQPLGLTQSAVRIGPRWVAQGGLKALKDAVTLQNSMKAISAKSDFMRLRAKTMMREINEVQNQVQSGMVPAAMERVLGKQAFLAKGASNAMHAGLFALIAKVQLVADVPTWLGAYDKATAGGHDERTAVDLADQAVRDSQGSGQIGDLAQIQRGSTWFKLWTQFYSFFSVGYNQLAESVAETRRVGPSRLPLLAADVALVAFAPFILGELLKRALRGDDWDWDELAPALLKGQVAYLLGYFVFARELGPMITSNGTQAGGSIRFFGDAAKLLKEVAQGENDDGLRKASITVGGELLHFPAAQINRTIDGFEAISKGETESPFALLFGPPRKAK